MAPSLPPSCTPQKPLGYCWRIYFKVLEVLFLVSVSQAFLPSKMTCGTHTYRHGGSPTVSHDKFAAFVTPVGVTFMKSSRPQYCLASLKLNSIWNRSR